MYSSKNKKYVSLILLILFIVSSIAIPIHQANAAAAFAIPFIGPLLNVGEVFINVISVALIGFASLVLSASLKSIFIPDVIYTTWVILRDFINLLYIFVLILMAFGTIFNVEKYTYKELLAPLLVSALLVNFSYALTEYVVHLGNLTTDIVLKLIQGDILNSIKSGFAVNITTNVGFLDIAIAVLNPIKPLINIIGLVVLTIVSVSSLLIAAFFAFFRTVAVWFLLFLSPLAFFSYSLPTLKEKVWSRWCKAVIKWNFFLPIYLLFLIFGSIFIKARGQLLDPTATTGDKIISFLGINDLFVFAITTIIVWGGLIWSFKIANSFGEGIGGALGAAKSLVKKIPIVPIGGKRVSFDKALIAGQDFKKRFEEWGALGKLGFLQKLPGGIGKEFFAGSRVQEDARKIRADKLGQTIGYSPQFAEQQAELNRIKENLEYLEDQKKNERIKFESKYDPVTKKIVETVVHTLDEKGNTIKEDELKVLRNIDGTLNAEAAAQRELITKLGIITEHEDEELIEEYGNNRNAQALAQHADNSISSNFKKIPDKELIKRVKAKDRYAYMANPIYNGYRKKILDYFQKPEGALSAEEVDVDTVKTAMDLRGGPASDKAWAEVFNSARIRPDSAGWAWGLYGQEPDGSPRDFPVIRSGGDQKDRIMAGMKYVVDKTKDTLGKASSKAYENEVFLAAVNNQLIDMELKEPTYQQSDERLKPGAGAEALNTIRRTIIANSKSTEKLYALETWVDTEWLELPLDPSTRKKSREPRRRSPDYSILPI